MALFHLLKIRTSIDIFKNEKCKVTFGLEYTFGTRTHKLLDDRTVTVQSPPATELTYEFRTISMRRLWRLHDNCTIFVLYPRGIRMAVPRSVT